MTLILHFCVGIFNVLWLSISGVLFNSFILLNRMLHWLIDDFDEINGWFRLY